MTRFSLTAWVCLLCTPILLARAGSASNFQLTGDQSRTTTAGTVLTGHARLIYGDAILTADRITYDQRKQVAVASGHVVLTRADSRLLADELTYRLEDQSFSVQHLRVGHYPVYASGDSLAGDPKKFTLTDATLYYGEPGPFSPTVSARSLTFKDRNHISAEGVHLGVGPVIPVPVPSFDRPIDQLPLSRVTATAGYRRSLGVYTELGAEIPVLPDLDLGASLGLYTARGLLAGPIADYDANTDSGRMTGHLETGYIHDYGDRLDDFLGRPISADRGFIEWTHHQTAGDHFSLVTDIAYWSDSEVLRDFRPDEFYGVQIPDSFAEAAYASNNYIFSAFTRFAPNDFARVQRRLPEIRFDLLPLDVGAGIYERFNASFATLSEDIPAAGITPDVNRLDAYYGLSRPWSPREGITLTPVAGGRVTHYSDTLSGSDSYTRTIGEVGFDARLQAAGTYAYTNKIWGIDGLRHLVTPGISYRYAPEADRGRAEIIPIDREVFSTYLQPLGLADTRSIDDLHALNTLRLSLANTLQTRDKTYGSRDLARLDLAADWHLDQPPGSDDFSDLNVELALTPAPWIEVAVFQRLDSSTAALRELNTALTLRDGRAWSLQLSSHYLEDQIEEYRADYRLRLNELYSVLARLDYDSRNSRFIEQTYSLEQRIRNLWTIRYGITLHEGPRRESAFGFRLAVQLARF